MNKRKIWCVVALILIILGCALFALVMTLLQWDFRELTTVKYETETYDFLEEYGDIKITTDTAKLTFVAWEEDFTRVVCFEEKKVRHSVSVTEDTLLIEANDQRKWYDHIRINFKVPSITVYMPKGEYGFLSIKSSTGDVDVPDEFLFEGMDITLSTGDAACHASVKEKVKIKTSTGDILLEGVSAASLDLSVSTGKVTVGRATVGGEISIEVSTGDCSLSDITCKVFSSHGDTGSITLKKVVASENFHIERSTGDVIFYGCDAPSIFVKTDTGDVKGTLCTAKTFDADTDTGKVQVPESQEGGRCTVRTSTGDILLSIEQ